MVSLSYREHTMKDSSATSSSLKEYLKKYESNNEDEKKKKIKMKKNKSATACVLVVDEDPIWQKPLKEEEESNELPEEAPQVDEDIEVKRMKRLELRSRQPYHAISEDGSGWVPVTHSPNLLNSMDSNIDISPPRNRKDSNIDMSPPRKVRVENYMFPPKSILEPLVSKPCKDSSDLSPQGNLHRHQDSLSPEPKLKSSESNIGGTDLSPPRRQGRRTPFEPQSTGGSHMSSNLDLSPPRRRPKDASSLKELSKSGIMTRKDFTNDISKTKMANSSRFEAMDPSLSGRHGVPIYRDKRTGNEIYKDEFLKLQKKEEKPKVEKKLEWGKGLAQKREAEERYAELEIEKSKPFARRRDDPELDDMLRKRKRCGDPMEYLTKEKHYDETILPDLGSSEKMKASGFIIPQEIPNHSWIKRGIDAPPNRYGIMPGRHWDGVDRSNGFDKELIKRQNEKQAMEKEAYLWSVADM